MGLCPYSRKSAFLMPLAQVARKACPSTHVSTRPKCSKSPYLTGLGNRSLPKLSTGAEPGNLCTELPRNATHGAAWSMTTSPAGGGAPGSEKSSGKGREVAVPLEAGGEGEDVQLRARTRSRGSTSSSRTCPSSGDAVPMPAAWPAVLSPGAGCESFTLRSKPPVRLAGTKQGASARSGRGGVEDVGAPARAGGVQGAGSTSARCRTRGGCRAGTSRTKSPLQASRTRASAMTETSGRPRCRSAVHKGTGGSMKGLISLSSSANWSRTRCGKKAWLLL